MSQFDWRDMVRTAADHDARANQHRPTDRELLRREVMRLHTQGLRPRDIAESFGMNPSDVITLIYSTGVLAE
jgi:hypothetical protein